MKFYGSFGIILGFFGYFVEISWIYISEVENCKTLIMGDKSINGTRDPGEVRFSRLKE